MITDGRFYGTITGEGPNGNEKYSKELKEAIEKAGQLCLDNLNNEIYHPIMLLGSIQSGKTRAFIGLMSLCFDNDFDMTIILTKCSTALVKQTVSRMTAEFNGFRTGMSTVGDVIAQDILDIDFSGKSYMEDKETIVTQFLRKYKGKKRIVVVKKQADNVDRMNMFIEQLVKQGTYKRILIVDDEADITSIGYEKRKQQDELSLRRISGAINTMRKQLHSTIEHVLMQVTATPYALYLQPEAFSNNNIMPVRPQKTVVLPTGKGYIGGEYYFVQSEDPSAQYYQKARFLPCIVDQEEMNILNGSKKNSGKNSVITDGRVVKMFNFVRGQSVKPNFALTAFREWIFDVLVGTAIIQCNQDYEGFYVSAVLHAAISKQLHRKERELIEGAFQEILTLLKDDVNDVDVEFFIEEAYERMKDSVIAYGALRLPKFSEIKSKIASLDEQGELVGVITEVDVKEVNSDNDIKILLNDVTGELKLENSLTIFVGGQVLDRGITIPNMISFFYGRDPETMQQDTVMQHCRMFGYRTEVLLSVTRFYTTYRLFSNMKEISIRDSILRERMKKQEAGSVVYLEAGGKIKACSPQKVLASNVHNILPEKRYLPVGFDVDKKAAIQSNKAISKILQEKNAFLGEKDCVYHKGEDTAGKYIVIDAQTALDLLRYAYDAMQGHDDGQYNQFEEIERILLFSVSERMISDNDEVALIVRENRNLAKMKRGGSTYQDAPDDGNNEGALAKKIREKMPTLVMTEQCNPEWGAKFWWPVYYTPTDCNVGIYAEEQARTGVDENVYSLGTFPIQIEKFTLVDNVGFDKDNLERFKENLENVKAYYNKHFYVENLISQDRKRKKIECCIYVEPNDSVGTEEEYIEIMQGIKEKSVKVLQQACVAEDEIKDVIAYYDEIILKKTSDEKRDAARKVINTLAKKTVIWRRLMNLMNEAEELLSQARECMGVFTVTGAGKCEIRLFYGVMAETLIEAGMDLSHHTDMGIYVMAHEMFHALHYADVMTESGRWLYKNRAYHIQGTVKETLAEYFGLQFVKDILQNQKLNEYIHNIRNEDEFPKDGGYSGALILERQNQNGVGVENDVYKEVLIDSLKDMPKAYDEIVKGL